MTRGFEFTKPSSRFHTRQQVTETGKYLSQEKKIVMPYQHFLPATFLACFSTDTTPERRQRMLTVGDTTVGRTFTAPASKVCGVNNLYTLTEEIFNQNIVDNAWTFYEKGLAPALEQLINQTLTCKIWANTLVPFVTGLLIRGPDFNERFEKRLANIGVAEFSSSDNTNMARLFENQRLSSSVLGAKWIILKARGNEPLITNDLGYAPFLNPLTQDFGIAIPISLDHILIIAPKLKRRIAIGIGGTWWPIIEYMDLPINNHVGLNQTIAGFSRRFIFGPDNDVINSHLFFEKKVPRIPEPIELGFMGGDLAIAHEMTWFRLISAISNPPSHDGDVIFVDYIKNAKRT